MQGFTHIQKSSLHASAPSKPSSNQSHAVKARWNPVLKQANWTQNSATLPPPTAPANPVHVAVSSGPMMGVPNTMNAFCGGNTGVHAHNTPTHTHTYQLYIYINILYIVACKSTTRHQKQTTINSSCIFLLTCSKKTVGMH